MNNLSITKTIVDMIVSAGAGAVVGNAIKQSTPIDVKITQKISLAVGGFVLSGMVGSHASKYVSEQIDSTVVQIQALKASLKKN